MAHMCGIPREMIRKARPSNKVKLSRSTAISKPVARDVDTQWTQSKKPSTFTRIQTNTAIRVILFKGDSYRYRQKFQPRFLKKGNLKAKKQRQYVFQYIAPVATRAVRLKSHICEAKTFQNGLSNV